MDISLTEIIPKGSSFTLRSTGQTYRLRPLSILDEEWIKDQYGEGVVEIFKQERLKDICRIVYRLLEEEDKLLFPLEKREVVDEEGNKAVINLGGVNLLMALTSGPAEKEAMMNALLECIGFSRPLVDKMIEEQEKKRLEKINQAMKEGAMTGHSSLTSSQKNMDGEPSISFPGPSEKFSGE